MKANRDPRLTVLFVLASAVLVSGRGQSALANERPVAEAGLPRYAAKDSVRLDGSGSYDPDHSGPLTYTWTQVSGPPLVISGARTATPTIGRFVQTDQAQVCEFQLEVGDGGPDKSADTAKVIIVPQFGGDTLNLASSSFDPTKPTVIYFQGGDCVYGLAGDILWLSAPPWTDCANVIDFRWGYEPDGGAAPHTYYKYGDMIIAYLSNVAPDYRQPIQTSGHSTGGQPAIDVAIRLNLTYKDARYAVNRVTFLDATPYCRANYQESIERFLANPVDGEQCWIDNYVSTPLHSDPRNIYPGLRDGVLNIWFESATNSSVEWLDRHHLAPNWYGLSLGSLGVMMGFNHGMVGGGYWSVVGPGKNLQLASTPNAQTYCFTWKGNASSGRMELYDELSYPGRLPEPVILVALVNRSNVSGDTDSVVLTCEESENAVGYQLLLGSDPYRVMDFNVVSDTPTPPTDVLRKIPSGETWWTIRVRDEYGSAIYADPIRLDLTSLAPMSVENTRTGKRYALIGHAIRGSESGDVILLGPATYNENIDFGGKTLTVRSLDPTDPVAVAGTVIRGQYGDPAVTFSGPEGVGGVLAGLTIQSAMVGVSCRNAVPTIRNCIVESPNGIAMEFWWGCKPKLIACTLLGQVKEGGDRGLIAYWKLDEAAGAVAPECVGAYHGTLTGAPVWQPSGGIIGGALQFDGTDDSVTTEFGLNPAESPFSVFAWVKGGGPGQVIVSQNDGANWLAVSIGGVLKTDLTQPGRNGKPLVSSAVITDGAWHRVGLTCGGRQRILYVGGTEVAKDATALSAGLVPSGGGLRFGVGSKLDTGTFWSGLIDDVRIYNQVVKP